MQHLAEVGDAIPSQAIEVLLYGIVGMPGASAPSASRVVSLSGIEAEGAADLIPQHSYDPIGQLPIQRWICVAVTKFLLSELVELASNLQVSELRRGCLRSPAPVRRCLLEPSGHSSAVDRPVARPA